MSSLLKPSTRSLSTFRPRSLFPSVTLSFLPHTLSLSLPLFLSWPSSLRCTHTHTHFYCSLSLLSPPHTEKHKLMRVCPHSHHAVKLPSPSPHIFSCSLSRNKELNKCQLALFQLYRFSLNPKLAKESAPIQQSGSLSQFTVERARSIYALICNPPTARARFHTHATSLFSEWPPGDLSAFAVDRETFLWV